MNISRKFKGAILLMAAFGLSWNMASLRAEPWHVATFTLSGKQETQCDNCLEGWVDNINTALRTKNMSPKLITGHIILVDLATPRLEFLMHRRDPTGVCSNHTGPVAYTVPERQELMPILLRTVPEWAHEVGAGIAVSATNFKFDRVIGVRAHFPDHPCGEMIGLSLRDGIVDWPPQDRPDLLEEPIDSNENWKADAILFYPNRTAAIQHVNSFDQIQQASNGFSGIALYIGDWTNPLPGTKPAEQIARLGIGILADRQHIIIIQLEGLRSTNKAMVPGVRLGRLTALLRAFGAIEAINLDGSGSAHMVGSNGFQSRPSDTEGARPIATMFGFRLNDAEVKWTSVEER